MTPLRHILTILLLSISFAVASAQTLHHDEGVSHWEFGLNIGLNNDGYEGSIHGLYFPVQYVGVKFGLSSAHQIEPIEEWGKEEWEKSGDYAFRIKINPAIVFRSPRLIKLRNDDSGIYLFAEPGIVLSPGSTGQPTCKMLQMGRQNRHQLSDIPNDIHPRLRHIEFQSLFRITRRLLWLS